MCASSLTPRTTGAWQRTTAPVERIRRSAAWATGVTAGPNENGVQTVTFEITDNTNPDLFTAGGQPAVSPAGALSFTPAADAFGEADITLKITDDGGTANGGDDESDTQTFTITVAAGEAAVGLGILIAFFRLRETADLDAATELKG